MPKDMCDFPLPPAQPVKGPIVFDYNGNLIIVNKTLGSILLGVCGIEPPLGTVGRDTARET